MSIYIFKDHAIVDKTGLSFDYCVKVVEIPSHFDISNLDTINNVKIYK